uniref:Uncharacterized protein n=1 Tax=Tanacetum cinerariifolium TaxID=118510 RepID=A0A6L2N8M2_TANCI|nr:hypothetical protein [Tanacetum cinerariifolium]
MELYSWESRFGRFLDNKLEEEERMWRSIEKGPYVRLVIPDPDDTKEQIIKPLSKKTKINKKQYLTDNNFPLPVKKVATARRKVKPLPGRLHYYQMSKRNFFNKWYQMISDDSEEMATVLTSMDAAIVLASGVVDVPTGNGSIPTASTPAEEKVPTGSDVVPTLVYFLPLPLWSLPTEEGKARKSWWSLKLQRNRKFKSR